MDRFLGDIVIVQGLTMPMMLESTGHFLAAESCNLIIGLRSVIPFLTKVKKPSTCVLAGHVVRSFVNPCWNFRQDMDET